MFLQRYFPLGNGTGTGSGLSINKLFFTRYSPNVGIPVTVGPAVVTPTFGTGPWTHSWSTNSSITTANSPTSASTTFTSTDSDSCTAVDTVTDSLGAVQSISCQIEVQIGGLPK